MDFSTTTVLRIGAWRVDTKSGQISKDGETARLELRAMRLLLFLAERAGGVVSMDDLITHVWAGVAVSPDSVYQAVASLRRVLGDDSRQPSYIETVPRLGYRMVAEVTPFAEETVAPAQGQAGFAVSKASAAGLSEASRSLPRSRSSILWSAAIAVCVVAGTIFVIHDELRDGNHSSAVASTAQPSRSVAVLPFLDLTEGMKEEEFADGMTEELIDKISKLSGFRVPPPTSSFYYKGKQIPVADIAHALNVAYVLDGSVRKSGVRLRVAARLIRADNGYVVWSESYDRPLHDILMVQDDIAGEVTKALKASLENKPSEAP